MLSKMGDRKLLRGYHFTVMVFLLLNFADFFVLKGMISSLNKRGFNLDINTQSHRNFFKIKFAWN
jgi:hypothetical protein